MRLKRRSTTRETGRLKMDRDERCAARLRALAMLIGAAILAMTTSCNTIKTNSSNLKRVTVGGGTRIELREIYEVRPSFENPRAVLKKVDVSLQNTNESGVLIREVMLEYGDGSVIPEAGVITHLAAYTHPWMRALNLQVAKGVLQGVLEGVVGGMRQADAPP
jgi:hypothetical protein